MHESSEYMQKNEANYLWSGGSRLGVLSSMPDLGRHNAAFMRPVGFTKVLCWFIDIAIYNEVSLLRAGYTGTLLEVAGTL